MQKQADAGSGTPVFDRAMLAVRAIVFAPARVWQAFVKAIPALKDGHFLWAIGLSIVAGMLCAVLPWWALPGLLLGIGLLVATAIYPLAGLVVTFLLAYEAIPALVAPEIPLGVFKLKPYELVFLWTIFVYSFRTMLAGSTGKTQMPAFTVPVTFILSWVLIGLIYGKFFQHNGELVLAEARGFLGLLAVPVVQLIVRERRDIERLSFWIALVGVVLSIYIILQAVTGMRILGGRLESLDSGSNSDVTRTVVEGVYVQGFALYYMALSLRTGRQFRYWLIPLGLIVLLGLLATFTRGAWVAAAFAGLIVAYLAAGWRGFFIAMVLGTIMVVVTVSAAYVLKPRVAEAVVERALGIGQEISHGASFGWRKLENEKALEVISQHPLLGVGIGGAYKNVASAQGHFDNEYYFIHNAYLYFPLKMGLIAGLGPLLIAGAFALLLLRLYRQTSGRVGNTVAACAGTVVMIYVLAIEGPVLKTFPGLLGLGTALALVASTYRLMHQTSAPEAREVVGGGTVRPLAIKS